MRPGPHPQATAARAAHDARAGFALIDLMLALVILALIAAIVFPGVRRPAGPLALRTAAYELSAMLRNMRTAAIGAGHPVEARIERGEAGLRVAAGPFAVEMPPDTAVALLDRRQPAVRFAPDGTSSGGTFLIQRAASRVTVAVNADTGAIDVAVP